MADRYVYSGASGSANGTSWANAYTTVNAGIAGISDGDDVLVAHDHAETGASSLTVSTGGSYTRDIVSVNRGGSVPPGSGDVQKGAKVTTTGASNIDIQFRGYMRGLIFNAGSGAVTAHIRAALANNGMVFEDCELNVKGTAGGNIYLGGAVAETVSRVQLLNSTVSFGSTGGSLNIYGQGDVLITGPSAKTFVQGATIPTMLIGGDTQTYSTRLIFQGVDLSNIPNLMRGQAGIVKFINCRLHSSVVVISDVSYLRLGTPPIDVINCHSSTSPFICARYMYQGALTTETTIVRTGGASVASTAYSWKIVPSLQFANCNDYEQPFECFEIDIEDVPAGSPVTFTFHLLTDNLTLTDRDVQLDCHYLGSSSYPLSTFARAKLATRATPANIASDSGTAWTTTGLTTPSKQKIAITVTPAMAGTVRLILKYGRPSGTVYICPKPDIS